MSHKIVVDGGRTSINATLTWRDSDVDSLVMRFLSNCNNKSKIIGLDTEWTLPSSDDKEQQKKHTSQTAIIVLCDGESCLIFRLPYEDDDTGAIPNSLFNFLRLADYTFVGMGINAILAKLEKEYGMGCKNAVELGPLAAQVKENPRLSAYGVDELAVKVDELKLDRPTCVAFKDWGTGVLNRKQIKCATLNAYAYFRIGRKLLVDDD